jgi:hypothetical protein
MNGLCGYIRTCMYMMWWYNFSLLFLSALSHKGYKSAFLRALPRLYNMMIDYDWWWRLRKRRGDDVVQRKTRKRRRRRKRGRRQILEGFCAALNQVKVPKSVAEDLETTILPPIHSPHPFLLSNRSIYLSMCLSIYNTPLLHPSIHDLYICLLVSSNSRIGRSTRSLYSNSYISWEWRHLSLRLPFSFYFESSSGLCYWWSGR